ncbi:Transcription factor MYB44 [Porphyridium purpureum]|uniref:Transcription factor MYB44 n=1 Tax=Porphyridium purpureum TaxID=35688 RepID=A0A5J4YGJ8_PORPP|nr:Transcription factor MYB44 [Porphyridium purpureum]|eukprot:POR1659..scf267_23
MESTKDSSGTDSRASSASYENDLTEARPPKEPALNIRQRTMPNRRAEQAQQGTESFQPWAPQQLLHRREPKFEQAAGPVLPPLLEAFPFLHVEPLDQIMERNLKRQKQEQFKVSSQVPIQGPFLAPWRQISRDTQHVEMPCHAATYSAFPGSGLATSPSRDSGIGSSKAHAGAYSPPSPLQSCRAREKINREHAAAAVFADPSWHRISSLSSPPAVPSAMPSFRCFADDPQLRPSRRDEPQGQEGRHMADSRQQPAAGEPGASLEPIAIAPRMEKSAPRSERAMAAQADMVPQRGAEASSAKDTTKDLSKPSGKAMFSRMDKGKQPLRNEEPSERERPGGSQAQKPVAEAEMAVSAPTARKPKHYWTAEEDETLMRAVKKHGARNWGYLARHYFQLRRSELQLRARWAYVLQRRGFVRTFTAQEDEYILRSYHERGAQWSVFARELTNCTDQDVKLRFRKLRNAYTRRATSSSSPSNH